MPPPSAPTDETVLNTPVKSPELPSATMLSLYVPTPATSFALTWMKWMPDFDMSRLSKRTVLYGDISDQQYSEVVKDISAMSLITADDPPIYMFYRWHPDFPKPTDPDKAWRWGAHNVIFGIKLKEKMDKLGVEAHLQYPDAKVKYESMMTFLIAKLKPDSTVSRK